LTEEEYDLVENIASRRGAELIDCFKNE